MAFYLKYNQHIVKTQPIIKTSEMQPTISGVISFGAENTVFFSTKRKNLSQVGIFII